MQVIKFKWSQEHSVHFLVISDNVLPGKKKEGNTSQLFLKLFKFNLNSAVLLPAEQLYLPKYSISYEYLWV